MDKLFDLLSPKIDIDYIKSNWTIIFTSDTKPLFIRTILVRILIIGFFMNSIARLMTGQMSKSDLLSEYYKVIGKTFTESSTGIVIFACVATFIMALLKGTIVNEQFYRSFIKSTEINCYATIALFYGYAAADLPAYEIPIPGYLHNTLPIVVFMIFISSFLTTVFCGIYTLQIKKPKEIQLRGTVVSGFAIFVATCSLLVFLFLSAQSPASRI